MKVATLLPCSAVALPAEATKYSLGPNVAMIPEFLHPPTVPPPRLLERHHKALQQIVPELKELRTNFPVDVLKVPVRQRHSEQGLHPWRELNDVDEARKVQQSGVGLKRAERGVSKRNIHPPLWRCIYTPN